jgi:integrase
LLHFADAMADDIDQSAIDRACADLLRPCAKPATRLRQIISPLRAILTHGAKRRMCQMPVFETGKESPGRTEWLTPAQVDALLAAAAPHLRPLLGFLASTGARMGEALVLDWKDVDLRHCRATLRGVLEDGERGTKSGRDRIVDLCPRALAALRFDPREKKRRGAIRAMVGRVFLTRAGRPYAKRKVQGGGQIKTGWAAAKRRAGINSPVSPHGLRHSWASWHYAMHKDLILLRHTGGWSTVDLVERYAHLTPPGMAAEIEAWRARDTLLAVDQAPQQKKESA